MMLILFAALPFVSTQGIGKSDFFQRIETCNDTSALVFDTISVLSNVHCAMLCLESDRCRSYSVELSMPSVCYLNADTLAETGCVSPSLKHYNSKLASHNPCLHDGVYNASDDTCRCFHGYVGSRCKRLMIDCSEGMASGHYIEKHGIYNIHPHISPTPFTVWCNMHYHGQIVVMEKNINYPHMNFNRTWEDYKHGFGDMVTGGNFWLGNERLYYVTNQRPMTLGFQITTDQEVPRSAEKYRQRFYKEFKISPEASGYNCSYHSSYSPLRDGGIYILGDCLAEQKMMRFSTIDVDNDIDDRNCAEVHLSGWWYSDCGGCNPTGKLQPKSDIYQNSDPTYVSVPVSNSWAPRRMQIYLEYYDE